MRRLQMWSMLCGAAVLTLSGMVAAQAPELVSHGSFEQVPLLMPKGEPQRVVIWLAGAGNAAKRQAQAEALRADGAMVALVDTAHLYVVLRKVGKPCTFSVGDVENFSRYAQAVHHLPTYRLPLLVGDGEGAALAYASATQAKPHMLAGLLTDGLCPAMVSDQAICKWGVRPGSNTLVPVPLQIPWVLAGSQDKRCPAAAEDSFLKQVPQARTFTRSPQGDILPGLRAAARVLGEQKGVALPPPPGNLADLPVVEMPAKPDGDSDDDTFVIFVSGDGGWAGLDEEVSKNLVAQGIPVVGLDSLRYFWTERTPQGLSTDLDRIARVYAQRWQRQRLVLIGFSQGADVLPAAINKLPAQTKRNIRLTALVSAGKLADYEFHVSNWLGSDDEGLPIAPEVQRLPAGTTVCIYGQDDEEALCPSLPADSAKRVALPGDHHYNDDYPTVARAIIEQLHGLSKP
ncbi:AcvB/VirJ family lysyl-phosphatidylglycerol hydrolase [Xanthomonas fragariae]|uniref:Virulence protein n=2 Tax=Xanthomonas fragariae TaxID=48664 RepID=A0A1Y6HKF0_9XANT|nr:AcvB/VirJ family lysyl-phosphatidylglycerol hydrolase [Xanthomonas fragariae]AOD15370.1 acid virulence protein B [Xanthomonas fragariae]AOD18776.1 acid virulence protein B [Xanthomonas fragariae]MBL9196440.1 virulence factor family protein [Xanthomonas fragariae]MBL9221668.1 virulence factor family protein [Xanthomonas fragariae]MDM7554835.1 AcvB/VirJ family lysyl-phosphatidylglycerol hydrolase [Xanthomonas fragariae]